MLAEAHRVDCRFPFDHGGSFTLRYVALQALQYLLISIGFFLCALPHDGCIGLSSGAIRGSDRRFWAIGSGVLQRKIEFMLRCNKNPD